MIRSSTPHSAASQPPSNSLAAHGTPWVEGRDVKCATLYQARHTQPPLARSLTASHGSPLRRQRTQRSHGSPMRKREGIQGAPYATTVRSIDRSPSHVSRLATGEREATPKCATPNHRSFAHSFANSRLTARHWSHGGHTRGRHTQPPFVRSLVRQFTSHGSPLVTWKGHKGRHTPPSLASSLANSRLTDRHWEGSDTKAGPMGVKGGTPKRD